MLTNIQRTNYSPQFKLQSNKSKKQTQPAFSGVVAKAAGGAYGTVKCLATNPAGLITTSAIGATGVISAISFGAPTFLAGYITMGAAQVRLLSKALFGSVKGSSLKQVIKNSAQAFDKFSNKSPKIF